MKLYQSMVVLVALLFSSALFSQNTTTLTGTVTDSDAQVWAYATWSAQLYIPGGGAGTATFATGGQVPSVYQGTLSSGGVFSGSVGNALSIVPPNVQWVFTVCSITDAPCQTLQPVTVSGSSFNIGAYVSSQITAPRVQATKLAYAYNASELLGPFSQGVGYVNTVSGIQYWWVNGAWSPNTPYYLGGLILTPAYGGTGQNSSTWNGLVQVVNGVWGTVGTSANYLANLFVTNLTVTALTANNIIAPLFNGTMYVWPSLGDPIVTIQSAWTTCNNNCTVDMIPGTYTSTSSTPLLISYTTQNLKGDARNTVIINYSGGPTFLKLLESTFSLSAGPKIGGFTLNCTIANPICVSIGSSIGTTLYDLTVAGPGGVLSNNPSSGDCIQFHNTNGWTERWYLEAEVGGCSNSLHFLTPTGTGTTSYGYGQISLKGSPVGTSVLVDSTALLYHLLGMKIQYNSNGLQATTIATASSGSTTLTVTNPAGILPGQAVITNGVPSGDVVAQTYTIGSTSVPLTAATTSAVTTASATAVVNTTATASGGSTSITLPSAAAAVGVEAGQLVTSASVPANDYVANTYVTGSVNVPLTIATNAPMTATVVSFNTNVDFYTVMLETSGTISGGEFNLEGESGSNYAIGEVLAGGTVALCGSHNTYSSAFAGVAIPIASGNSGVIPWNLKYCESDLPEASVSGIGTVTDFSGAANSTVVPTFVPQAPNARTSIGFIKNSVVGFYNPYVSIDSTYGSSCVYTVPSFSYLSNLTQVNCIDSSGNMNVGAGAGIKTPNAGFTGDGTGGWNAWMQSGTTYGIRFWNGVPGVGSLIGQMLPTAFNLSIPFMATIIESSSTRGGTFVCTASGSISVANANVDNSSDITLTLSTPGGTITTPPAEKTITSGAGFSVLCGATDTSTYRYRIWN